MMEHVRASLVLRVHLHALQKRRAVARERVRVSARLGARRCLPGAQPLSRTMQQNFFWVVRFYMLRTF